MRRHKLKYIRLNDNHRRRLRQGGQRRPIKDRAFVEISFKGDTGDSKVSAVRKRSKDKRKRVQYHCPYCPRGFGSQSDLSLHITRAHTSREKPLQCKYCKICFASEMAFARHSKTLKDDKLYPCQYCGDIFSRKTHMKIHLLEYCEKKNEARAVVQNQRKDKVEGFQFECEYCEQCFELQDQWTEHRQRHAKKGTPLFRCERCRKSFGYQKYLSQHMHAHSSHPAHDQATYQCDYCKKHFATENALMMHVKDRLNKTYTCEYCGECFVHRNHHDYHLHNYCQRLVGWRRQKSVDERTEDDNPSAGQQSQLDTRYQCDTCEKCFRTLGMLRKHLRTLDCNDKTFQCEYCGKCFRQNSNLTIHLRIHTQERPYRCQYCYKSFAYGTVLTRHIRSHTQERPHRCEICHKSFAQRYGVTLHMAVHSQEKPFQCEYCQKCFARKRNLRRHLRTHLEQG